MKTTDKPSLQGFHIEGVRHINPTDALEAITNGDAVMLDVREINEVKLESVPLDRVLNHPMSVIMDRLPYISKDQNIIIACPGGMRSTKVVNLLMLNGYNSVTNLDGGLKTWKAKGLPIESNSFSGECNCISNTKPNATILITNIDKNIANSIDYKNLRSI